MAAGDVEPRSKERLTKNHLRRLVRIAQDDLQSFFDRHRRLKDYQERPQLTALCQGAALHYLDHTTGVKDLDVWTFFADLPRLRLQRRRPRRADFGVSTLGRHPDDEERGYAGRKVDLLLKTIPRRRGQRLDDAVRDYLRTGTTKTARCLAEKTVIGLDPPEYFGVTIWPVNEPR
jgi:hypothetical protein